MTIHIYPAGTFDQYNGKVLNAFRLDPWKVYYVITSEMGKNPEKLETP